MIKPMAVGNTLDDIKENTWVTRSLASDTRLYTKPDRNTTILLPQGFCHSPIDLLVIIASMPKQSELRSAVRDTWGSYKYISNYTIRTYFLIGQTYDNDLQVSNFEVMLILKMIKHSSFAEENRRRVPDPR